MMVIMLQKNDQIEKCKLRPSLPREHVHALKFKVEKVKIQECPYLFFKNKGGGEV